MKRLPDLTSTTKVPQQVTSRHAAEVIQVKEKAVSLSLGGIWLAELV